ncbi:MAG: hypothetical protein KME08_08875 [Aphanothece sp. CMT-3BRIN-NPC111]|jgi:hypothetical protein|nr:hypothetical protein [Aphanothece sp. CMT-3BRIN-NPC111]
MTTAMSFPNAPDVSADDYLVLGLATCFYKEDGEVHQVKIVEPIPSAALEAILKGIPTSYEMAYATTLGDVIPTETPQMPALFPAEAQLSDEFVERALAAVRTYKRRPEAQSHIPIGSSRNDFQYTVERKRVLNASRVVTKDDNVKQHSHTHKVL